MSNPDHLVKIKNANSCLAPETPEITPKTGVPHRSIPTIVSLPNLGHPADLAIFLLAIT
tara:strand:- start:163 stop:339 length:177 start_codon:yes stop_codon:yes gene_type:complete